MSKAKKSKTQNFYDRIADVHNLALKVNGYRKSVEKFLRALDLQVDENAYVLDAGSGTGIVTLGFQSAGFRPKKQSRLIFHSILYRFPANNFRKTKRRTRKISRSRRADILALPFPDETFDLILTCGVLEYVSLDEGFRELARVAKTGAKLVLIPVKPSIIGSVLEILYNFKTHPLEDVRRISQQYFKIVGDYEFPITEPIGWSKKIFLLEKK